jgi:hypothetical protein
MSMRIPLVYAAATVVSCLVPLSVRAMSLDQACQMFASKLNAAQAAGDTQKSQMIYQEGSRRIASRFNGATCPTIKPPTP